MPPSSYALNYPDPKIRKGPRIKQTSVALEIQCVLSTRELSSALRQPGSTSLPMPRAIGFSRPKRAKVNERSRSSGREKFISIIQGLEDQVEFGARGGDASGGGGMARRSPHDSHHGMRNERWAPCEYCGYRSPFIVSVPPISRHMTLSSSTYL